MAVTKKNVNGIFYFTYPSSDVFLKERNYFIFEGIEQTYITSIKIGSKTLNFGQLALINDFYLDVSAYYAKYKGKFSVTIYYNDYRADLSYTVTINANTYNCYDPYKELVPRVCDEHQYIMIAPPHRMLFTTGPISTISSLFVTKCLQNYIWEVNDVNYTSQLIIQGIPIKQTNFVAKYKIQDGPVVSTLERIADFVDNSREWIQVTWRTRWGFDVSHIFYLDTYATDKDDAQEVESEYFYEEHSKHVIKGSFYLDNIRNPYDLWYYQTLAQSELVILVAYKWSTIPRLFIPNGTNDFNGVKITGCNIKDAVVDGVTQSTITFDFEMR